jgi:hypothetical protein
VPEAVGREAELRHAAALADVPLEAAAEAADHLAGAGLLEPGRPLRFAHPILRSVVYAAVPAGRRADTKGVRQSETVAGVLSA